MEVYMNNKKLCIALMTIGFLTACKTDVNGDFIEPIESTLAAEAPPSLYDIDRCYVYKSLLMSGLCPEQRAYPEQVDNAKEQRFDFDAYHGALTSNELPGLWLMVAFDSEKGMMRQTCEIKIKDQQSNTYSLHCPNADEVTLTYHDSTNKLYSAEQQKEWESTSKEKVVQHYSFEGQVYNGNKIDGKISGVKIYQNGEQETFSENRFDFVRLGPIGMQLGSFWAEKREYSTEQVLARQEHDIFYFYETKAQPESNGSKRLGDLKFYQSLGDAPVVKTKNNVKVQAALYTPAGLFGYYGVLDLIGSNNFDYNKHGVMVFLGQENIIDTETTNQKAASWVAFLLRQLNYQKLNTNQIQIDFLMNRLQATRFERPDIVGEINVQW